MSVLPPHVSASAAQLLADAGLAPTVGESWPFPARFAGLTADSRAVLPGGIFVAVPGTRRDGHDFIPAALDAGAALIVAGRGPTAAEAAHPALNNGMTGWRVAEPRAAYARLAAAWYGNPQRQLRLVAVTGTKGKTSFTYLMEKALKTLIGPGAVGVMGTVSHRWGSHEEAAGHTTPDALDIARVFAAMVQDRVQVVVMEVSSHALEQRRVEALDFEVAAFTHLTRDHLDYHGSMEAYGQAKARLFAERLAPGGQAVIPVRANDPWSPVMAAPIADPARLWAVDMPREGEEAAPDAALGGARNEQPHRSVAMGSATPVATDWIPMGAKRLRLGAYQVALSGVQAEVSLGDSTAILHSPLAGRHNLENLLLALGACMGLGFGLEKSVAALSGPVRIPGRLEAVEHQGGFAVFVDYAHAPAPVAEVLRAVRLSQPRRIIALLGCGGDRDRGKRPLMARAALEGADICVFTSDNPRTESPAAILDDMVAGVDPALAAPSDWLAYPRQVASHEVARGWLRIDDRRAAIATALALAGPGDAVLLLGKGHENYQEINGIKYPFDDREEAAKALQAMDPIASDGKSKADE